MRIVFDYQTFSIRQYSGISRYFVELAAALGRMEGVEVRVVGPLLASRFLAERRDAVRAVGVDVSRAGRLPLRVVRGANRMLFPLAVTGERPEIVHETLYDLRRRAPRGARVVTTMHDTTPERMPELFPDVEEHRARVRASLQRADAVICVSEWTRRDVLELYDVDPQKVRVVRLASSLKAVDEAAEGAEPYFLHVGARYHYKNFGVLVEALGRSGLWRTHRLRTFSSHALTCAEWEAVEKAGIPRERVEETGGDDGALARAYAGATAMVLPSLYEGFGIPVVEAMRCGCPVIASGVSSLPEVGGDAALYCDPRDAESWAAAMRRVAEDGELREAMVKRGRERAAQFSWEHCAQETLAVYRELLARDRAPVSL